MVRSHVHVIFSQLIGCLLHWSYCIELVVKLFSIFLSNFVRIGITVVHDATIMIRLFMLLTSS